MNNLQVYQQARISRDVRFDGLFFIAVKSTGVFCRTICPAKLPAEKNVAYYETASAAVLAGFRPCLRCRPDSAPGSYDWNNKDGLADKVAKKIENGELQDQSLQRLCSELGISTRYLHKVFLQRYGVAPKFFQQISKCLFAKKLLQETRLSICDVALSSGFNSISLFNNTFKRYFKMTPNEVRKENHIINNQEVSIKLFYRPPYNWDFFLNFQKKRMIDGMEWIEEGRYGRTINLLGEQGYFEISNDEEKNAFTIKIALSHWTNLQLIISKIKRLLDINVDIEQVESLIKEKNPSLPLINGIRIPGVLGTFESGVKAICGQQISVTAAKNLVSNIVFICDKKDEHSRYFFPTPEDIVNMNFSLLKTTTGKKNTIKSLAEWYMAENDPEDIDAWLGIKGIGEWTVNYVKLRAQCHSDIWMGGDLGIKQALEKNPGVDVEGVRPWRSYLTYQLWSHLDV